VQQQLINQHSIPIHIISPEK